MQVVKTIKNIGEIFLELIYNACSGPINVFDLEGIEAGMPLCPYRGCPYKIGIFRPRRTVESGCLNWVKGEQYIVCGRASQD